MSLPVRCIIRTDSPPYLPTIYNNDFQIFQSPGYVVIGPEMIHSARIIPLDGRPHLDKNLKQWLGDTRGHWEGNTLVVETTNFRTDDGVVFQGAKPATFKITERFTRVGADTINYEFTVEDPKTWTKPWTAMIPWNKIDPERADVRVRVPRRQLRHRALPDAERAPAKKKGEDEMKPMRTTALRRGRLRLSPAARCAAGLLAAHHAFAAEFDAKKPVKLRARSRRWSGSIPTPGSIST